MSDRLRAHYLNTLGVVRYRVREDRAGESTQLETDPERLWVQENQLDQTSRNSLSAVSSEASRNKQGALKESPATPKPEASRTGKSHFERAGLGVLAGALDASNAQPSLEAKNRPLESQLDQNPGKERSASEPTHQAFRLACWQVSSQLLVIDSLKPQERPDSRRIALLGNILKAIGRQPDYLPSADFFDWPLSPGADASFEEARIAVGSFLQGRMSQNPFRWVLAMGSEAIRCLAPIIEVPVEGATNSDSGTSNLLGKSFPLFAETALLCVPGLEDMLNEPGCKALTWQTIRFLNEAASGS